MRKLAVILSLVFVLGGSYFIFARNFTFLVNIKDIRDYGSYAIPGIYKSWLDYIWSLAYLDAYRPNRQIQLRLYPFYWTPYELKDPVFRARFYWFQGEFEKSIEILEQEVKSSNHSEMVLYWLALSYARLGEAKNCLLHLTSDDSHVINKYEIDEHAMHANHEHLMHDHFGHLRPKEKEMNTMCSLPLVMVHTQTKYSKRAVELFDELSNKNSPHKNRYLWLARFYRFTLEGQESAPMTQEMSNKFKSSQFMDFFSEENQSELAKKHHKFRLVNKAKKFGLDTLDAARGLGVEDFDNDGYLDIITIGSYNPIKYFTNLRGAGFKEIQNHDLSKTTGGFAITMGDVNNDGFMDFVLSRWFLPSLLFVNDGKGGFHNVTHKWGLPTESKIQATFIPSFADYDNDGDLDLFFARFATEVPFNDGVFEPSKLYRNDSGQFVDVTSDVGLSEILANTKILRGAWGDYDNDGFADLYLSSINSDSSLLLKNNKGRLFTKAVLYEPKSSFAASFIDFNHDGNLDLFSPGVIFSIDLVISENVFGEVSPQRRGLGETWVYENSHGSLIGTRAFPLSGRNNVMGVSYGDINGDGCLDFYLGTGSFEEAYVLPNLFYISKTVGTKCSGLENISPLQGLGTIQKGHGIVFFDYDNDGDDDIYSTLGGFWPGDRWPNQFFVNESDYKNSWVKIRLKGVRANRFGVGSLIRVIAINKEGQELIRTYHMDTKTDFGSAPLLAHIGLMASNKIVRVEVRWAGDTSWQTYSAKINSLNVLEQKP